MSGEVALTGGNTGAVVRVGDTVRRETGGNTGADVRVGDTVRRETGRRETGGGEFPDHAAMYHRDARWLRGSV